MFRKYFMPIFFVIMLGVFLLIDWIMYITGWTYTLSDWADVWGLRHPTLVIGGYFMLGLFVAWHFWIELPQPPFPPAPTAEQLAQEFHEQYERLAPQFGYKTREASAKPWVDVPEQNKALMIAVCAQIMKDHTFLVPMTRLQWFRRWLKGH
jgi:energy-coupling factor transporter transmembrane protein EcfT